MLQACNFSDVLDVFRLQYTSNSLYRNYCELRGKNLDNIKSVEDIPFLPITFFKSHAVVCGTFDPEIIFTSSGTSGENASKHYVKNVSLYVKSFTECFQKFYGNVSDYTILALLPSYLERSGSSLVYMVDQMIKESKHPLSGFFIHDHDSLIEALNTLEAEGRQTILLGVSFALLDLAEKTNLQLKHTIIMETGGMKGKRTELPRDALHETLKESFGVNKIHSEYGMTELLSQAYSEGDGRFFCAPAMRILIREIYDPLSFQSVGQTGGINIIDLNNMNSCAFIETQDLGRLHENGSFEVLGRFDQSEVRGCNLLVNG